MHPAQTGCSWLVDWNPGPFYFETTVQTTVIGDMLKVAESKVLLGR